MMNADEDDDIIFIKEVKTSPMNHSQNTTTNIFDKVSRQLELDFKPFSHHTNFNQNVKSIDKEDRKHLTDALGSLSIFNEDDSKFKGRENDASIPYDSDTSELMSPQWPIKADNATGTPENSRKRSTSNSEVNQSSSKKFKDDCKKDISSSPIARAFYSSNLKTKTNLNLKVGVSVPLCCRLKPYEYVTSLEPKTFATSRVDLLDGLAEDDIFQEAYSNCVLSYTTPSIIPPRHVAMHLLKVTAFSVTTHVSRKAVSTLRTLMCINALSYRNLPVTWDWMCSMASKMLEQLRLQNEVKTETFHESTSQESTSQESTSQDSEETCKSIPSVFLFMVDLMEYDLQRFRNNCRESIIWKLLSPSIFGNSRLRTVFQWLTECLNITGDHSESSKIMYHCSYSPIRLTELVTALQRLLNLVYQSARDPLATAETMAELYVDCFFDVPSAESRKRLLTTIELVVVQRKSTEMLLTTICEPASNSAHYENLSITLDKIVDDYFQRVPPKNQQYITSGVDCNNCQEEIEEFLFLLYIICRSYLQEKHSTAVRKLNQVSLVDNSERDVDPHFPLPFEDRSTFLTIQEDITFLKVRLASYTTCLSSKSLLYWNMIRVLFRVSSMSRC